MPTTDRDPTSAGASAPPPDSPGSEPPQEGDRSKTVLLTLLNSIDRLDEALRLRQSSLEAGLAGHGLDSPEAIGAAMAQAQLSASEAWSSRGAQVQADPASGKSRIHSSQLRGRV